jgi:uncharacterized damage-inducible protein DinB
MNFKDRLICRLTRSRDFSEKLLADFKSPEEWTHQVHPNSNHALWFAGHLGEVDNFAVRVIAPEKAKEPAHYHELFGMGSQPSNNPANYPPVDEVVNYMRERRQTLIAAAENLPESDLDKPMPKGAPAFLSDFASLLEMLAWHEGMHAGQLTVVRRALGHEPLMTRPPQESPAAN